MSGLNDLFPHLTIIPVVVIERTEDAIPLANALLEGGIGTMEITLRTEAALNAIESVAKHLPNMVVGSGTITSTQQMQQAADAGAVFHVSPGITQNLAQYASDKKLAWLPGTANASDIMLAQEHGFSHVKFFPASLSGGTAMLKQFSAVFPSLSFCPTGGINQQNMNEYAALKQVFAIGGSWLSPKDLIAEGKWSDITKIAKESIAALSR